MLKMKNLFNVPSPEELARRELEEARREWLQATSAAEYATAMAAYHAGRIQRLGAMVGVPTK